MRYRTNGDFGVPLVDPRAVGRRHPRRAVPLAVDRGVLRAHPGPQGRDALDPGGRGRAAPCGDPRPGPGAVPRAQEDVTGPINGEVPDGRSWRCRSAARRDARPGTDLTVVTYGYERHRCLEAADAARRGRGRPGRGHRRAVARAARYGDDAGVRSQDRARDGRLRGQPHLRRRRRDRGTRSPSRRCSTWTRPLVRIGGPDIPAMPYAAALEHFYTEPEPDHIYRAMRDLARF